MRIGLNVVGLSVCCAVMSCSSASGQDASQPVTTDVSELKESSGFGPVQYTFQPYITHQTSAGAADASGTVTSTRGGADLLASFRANDRTYVTLMFGGEYVNYNFEEDAGLPIGSIPPLGAASEVSAALLVNRVLNDSWTITGGGFISAAWEDGADLNDALTGGGLGGFQYRINPNLSLGLGLVVANQLEGSMRVLPVPLIDAHYSISSQWDFSASTLEGAALTFSPADQDVWRIRFGLNWEYSEYRLDDGDPHTVVVGGGSGPGTTTFVQGTAPDGVLSELRVPISAMLQWDFAQGWTAELGVETNVVHEFDVEDLNGEHIANQNFGMSPVFRFGVRGTF